MRDGATHEVQPARDMLSRIALAFMLFAAAGRLLAGLIGIPGLLHIGAGTNTFFVQYLRHEPPFLVLFAAFALAAAIVARQRVPHTARDTSHDTSHDNASLETLTSRASTRWLVAATVAVFAITLAGTWLVMHALPLSMDEFVAGFQAHVFASGALRATVPDTWRQFGQALTPVFVYFDREHAYWTAQYLPLYAVLKAPFVSLGADGLLNPLLAAASVPLVFAVARRLWPERPHRAWVAVGFLVTSSQFLFMSMTGYAMPAHLAINLLWLLAYLRDDRVGWAVLPVIGVAALGIHNPFPHALFAAPFLFYLLIRRRWMQTAYVAVVYLAGIALWGYWTRLVEVGGAGQNLLALFQTPGALMFATQEMSLTLILSWQTPLLSVALAVAVFHWKRVATMERLLLAGVLASFAFFLFFPSTQGHGWGYRYVYATLGNIVLLGAVGADALAQSLGTVATRRLAVASAVLTVLFQLPLRAWQIERYVRPFALAHEYVRQLDADVVIVDPTTSWYGIDLVRNDPMLRNRPKVLSAYYLRPADKVRLAQRFGTRAHMLEPNELAQFGIPVFPSRFRYPVWP